MEEHFVAGFKDELEKIAIAGPGFLRAVRGVGRALTRGGVGSAVQKAGMHWKKSPGFRRGAMIAGGAGLGAAGFGLGRASKD
jgi:hypothetical protein